MHAGERTITTILTDQICYEIPSYQRPYSWERENVQQLLQDVWEAFEAGDNEYFIGSLITIVKEKDRRYEVVDGQQRLTTLNIILACLRERIQKPAAKADLEKRILPRDAYTDEPATPRLSLRKKDQSFFRKHVLESQPLPPKELERLEKPQRRLVDNLDAVGVFCEGKTQEQLSKFAHYLLNSVYVVLVTTPTWKSAYRLFNVLNARGIPLSNADLIKNTLFRYLGPKDANRTDELEERWLELEDELGIERLDTFFGHHRTSLVAAKAKGTLHEEIEPLIKAEPAGPMTFMDGVIASARNYTRILEADFTDAATLRPLLSLQRVEYDEWIPPLLAILNRPISDLPESEFVDLLERITMQNWIRRLGRAARLTVYHQLISAIRDKKSADEVRQVFKKNAQNTEFMELLGGEVYGRPFDTAVLLRLEEAATDHSVTKTFSGQLTIEHVLPQALKDDYWRHRFDEATHAYWLHRLGNLALLLGRKNYRAQCHDFDRKKKAYTERNKKSSFDLTKGITDLPEWTAVQIKDRHERLLALAKQTWTIE